jgi:phenylacetyl-CoA:acceptor oxidoreductase subunit 2
MSREAFVASLLFPAGLLAAWGLSGWIWVTAALAMVFLFCQSRMLQAARGIPAWRCKVLPWLIFATGLCEGCGAFLLLGPWHKQVTPWGLLVFAVTVLARLTIWTLYRSRVDVSLAARARAALDRAGRWLWLAGSIAPLVLLGLSAMLASGAASSMLAALAGGCAFFAGAYFKYTLVTRASFNQGFALVKLPVRGTRDTVPLEASIRTMETPSATKP